MVSRLVEKMLEGDRHGLARLLTLLEQDAEKLSSVMRAVYSHAKGAYCIGVTGPPGAGKSTIVDGLVQIARSQGSAVGVLAVDPTSLFSGGALLGDRIRMQRHYLDQGVFIRSLATRGARGGLSRVARASVRLLDAFGMNLIIVETVGVGQTELDVIKVADTVVITLVPEAGDTIQTMKAGLMEIGDIFVVNKADREGAGRLAAAIRATLRLDSHSAAWRPPVLLTQAHKGEGVQALYNAISDHRRVMEETSHLAARRRLRQRQEFTQTVREAVESGISHLLSHDPRLDVLAAQVENGELDPYSAAAQVLDDGLFFTRLAATLGNPRRPDSRDAQCSSE